MILLDSTIVVGFLDGDDALHEASVATLRGVVRRQALAASVISYAEVMTGVSLGHHSRDRVERFFDVLIKDLVPVDREIAARAAELRGGHKALKMPDALILASADVHPEIDTILSGDERWPKVTGLRCKVEHVEGTQGA